MDGGDWQTEVHGLAKGQTQLSNFPFHFLSFPGGSDGKEYACSAGDPGSIYGFGISPREGTGNPLQHYCPKNSLDKGTW